MMSWQNQLTNRPLKNAIVAFFNPRQVRSWPSKMPISSSLWHRIHAMAQPVEFFNRLLELIDFAVARHG
jgi:hypothetical protein